MVDSGQKKNKTEHCERVSFHTNKNLCINIAQHHRAHIICMRYILEFRHNATTKTSRRVKEHKNKCRKNNNNKKNKNETPVLMRSNVLLNLSDHIGNKDRMYTRV